MKPLLTYHVTSSTGTNYGLNEYEAFEANLNTIQDSAILKPRQQVWWTYC